MASPPVLQARGLRKRFGSTQAVDGLDLEVAPGECLALLGPNGAGKTTTIEMLEGLTQPDEGSIEVLGLGWKDQADAIRERIGVQLQETRLQEKVTVLETLRLFRSFYRSGRGLDETLEIVGLTEKRKARVETLSGGQHQRLALACALVNRPELLFLDEPSTGLDPQARRRVWEIVEDFKAEGGSVLLTTHYMEEAHRLADALVIVDAGQIIARGTPAEVIALLGADAIVELKFQDSARPLNPADLTNLPGVKSVHSEGNTLRLEVSDTQASVSALMSDLQTRGVELEHLTTHSPTLEDVFVHLTGKQLRNG